MKVSYNFSGQQTVLEQLGAHRHALEAPCGGKGICGKCLVHLTDFHKLPDPTEEEIAFLSPEQLSDGWRLACLSRPTGTGTVTWQTYADEKHAFLTETRPLKTPSPALRSLKGAYQRYGVAIDIGTTTIAASLIDLSTGENCSQASGLNNQKAYGLDVLSRITHQVQASEGIDQLHRAVAASIEPLWTKLLSEASLKPEQICEITIAANTAMLHFLLKLPAESLGKAPYQSQISHGIITDSAALGLNLGAPVPCYLLPPVSAYIGGDISSGILETLPLLKQSKALLIDIGTNGELVLFNHHQIAACSCAAGPAFEGMNLSCGMRAEPGAVESLSLTENGMLSLKTIGNLPVKGLCGSGVFDLMAALIQAGMLGPTGRILSSEQLSPAYAPYVKTIGGKRCLHFETVLGSLTISQQDIRQIQLAKAALRSGLEALLNHFELCFDDLDHICVAGQFGKHLKADSLIGIGLLPETVREKLIYVGNTSHAGAETCLLDDTAKNSIEKLAKQVQYVELAELPGYERLFVDCLNINPLTTKTL